MHFSAHRDPIIWILLLNLRRFTVCCHGYIKRNPGLLANPVLIIKMVTISKYIKEYRNWLPQKSDLCQLMK